MAMMNTKQWRNARMQESVETMSASTYNLVLGGLVLYGFVVNAFMVEFLGDMFIGMNPWVFLISYIVCCLLGSFLARSRNSVVAFLGYNLIVVPIGVVLCQFLPGFSTSTVVAAFGATAGVAVLMTVLSTAFPNFFLKIGRGLFIGLLVGIVAEIVSMLFGYGGDLFNFAFVGLFSLYLGFDWARAQRYPKSLSNAIGSALDIYLDLINIFIRLLEIFGKRD